MVPSVGPSQPSSFPLTVFVSPPTPTALKPLDCMGLGTVASRLLIGGTRRNASVKPLMVLGVISALLLSFVERPCPRGERPVMLEHFLQRDEAGGLGSATRCMALGSSGRQGLLETQ